MIIIFVGGILCVFFVSGNLYCFGVFVHPPVKKLEYKMTSIRLLFLQVNFSYVVADRCTQPFLVFLMSVNKKNQYKISFVKEIVWKV